MDSRGSVRPTGQIESIETLSQKKKSKFERSETWVPCDNDEIVTKEILRQEAERVLGSGLREFISSSFGEKETIDEIFQEVWVRLLKKVENEIIYLSGLRQYTGKLAYGLILNKRRERTRSKTREESLTDNHTNREGSKGYRYELPQRIKADAETVVFLKEIFNFLNQRERAIFSLL